MMGNAKSLAVMLNVFCKKTDANVCQQRSHSKLRFVSRGRHTYLFFCEATEEASAPRTQRIQEAGTASFAAETN
jgi:hypothetical protein